MVDLAKHPQPLTKAETVALWYAVDWMSWCLKVPPGEEDAAAVERERELLKTAKRALRKVNAIRKAAAIDRKEATRG